MRYRWKWVLSLSQSSGGPTIVPFSWANFMSFLNIPGKVFCSFTSPSVQGACRTCGVRVSGGFGEGERTRMYSSKKVNPPCRGREGLPRDNSNCNLPFEMGLRHLASHSVPVVTEY